MINEGIMNRLQWSKAQVMHELVELNGFSPEGTQITLVHLMSCTVCFV